MDDQCLQCNVNEHMTLFVVLAQCKMKLMAFLCCYAWLTMYNFGGRCLLVHRGLKVLRSLSSSCIGMIAVPTGIGSRGSDHLAGIRAGCAIHSAANQHPSFCASVPPGKKSDRHPRMLLEASPC